MTTDQPRFDSRLNRTSDNFNLVRQFYIFIMYKLFIYILFIIMSFKFNNVNFYDMFQQRGSIANQTTILSGYEISGNDVYNIFLPLSANGPNLKYPVNIKFKNKSGVDLSQLFNLNLVNTASTTVDWGALRDANGDDTIIIISTSGVIRFNFNINKLRFALVAGGGGGGATTQRNAGGGGGAGEVVIDTVYVTKGQNISVTLGAGGNGGLIDTNNSGGAKGGNSSLVVGIRTVTANGGGPGGNGKFFTNPGPGNGGSGGGSGSYSNTVPDPGVSVKNTGPLDDPVNGGYYGNNGGRGEFQGNDTGRGGGGGGAGGVGNAGGGLGGSAGGTGGNGGIGIKIFTYPNGTDFYVAGGGGGGANSKTGAYGLGGLGGGGRGGFTRDRNSATQVAPSAGDTGGGGGGGQNVDDYSISSSLFRQNGARGGDGICIFTIRQQDINL
jgi:hypothetical protein